jgi:hypothetical protein
MGMKQILPILAVSSMMFIPACNKTQKTTTASTAEMTSEMDVDVNVVVDDDGTTITMNGEEVNGLPDDMMAHVMQMIGADGGEIVVMVNGEEQIIDIQDILSGADLEDMDGDISIEVMAFGDDEENTMRRLHTDGDNAQMFVIVNGEEVEGMSGNISADMMEHGMFIINSEQDTGTPGQMRMVKMKGGENEGPPEGMRGHMMQMKRGHDKDGGSRKMHSEWRSNPEHGANEEEQFMQELEVLGDVSTYLSDSNSVAMMGIHMIRDQLDGATRMHALEVIIEEELPGSASRNAALIVAIQTLQEDGDTEAAADLMVELVLSN